MAQLDHFVLSVKDVQASIAFYSQILGFAWEGRDEPFAVIRVNPGLTMLLVQGSPQAPEHYAFALTPKAFEETVLRIKAAGIAYGPAFDSVGANTGPGYETGARGLAPTLYFNVRRASAGGSLLPGRSIAIVGDIDQQAIALAIFAAAIQRDALPGAHAVGQVDGEGALEMDLRVGHAGRLAVSGDGLVARREQISGIFRQPAQLIHAHGAYAQHTGGVVLEDHFVVHGGKHGIDVDAVVGVDVAFNQRTHEIPPGQVASIPDWPGAGWLPPERVFKDPLIYSYVPVTALYARLGKTANPASLLDAMPGT
jgi:catechol 2,3-dioxygenase-like lactoylglutathione lyase family enzyme